MRSTSFQNYYFEAEHRLRFKATYESKRLPRYFREAFKSWFKSIGSPVKEMEANGLHLPILDFTVQPFMPIQKNEDLQLRLKVRNRKHSPKIEFLYEIRKDGQIAARGKMAHLLCRRLYTENKGLSFSPTPVPPSWFVLH